VLEIAAAKENGLSTRNWQGRIELPPVPIPTSIAQPKGTTADELIRRLGLKLVGGNRSESQEASRALSLIADERVIPWYVKAMDTNDYDLKFAALDRLSKFQGDEALAGLKKGMTTQGADIGIPIADAAGRRDLAENVRHAAAGALAGSPHPDARRLLLTMWNDPSRGVRITVLHALGEMKTEESLALLRRMTEDSDEMVRGEARRYLALRTAEAARPSDDGKKSEP
jgi:hypothetical protein